MQIRQSSAPALAARNTRQRRDLPEESFAYAKYRLLRQLEVRLRRHRTHLANTRMRLDAHLQAISRLRDNPDMPAEDKRFAERCIAQTERFVEDIQMLELAAQGIDSVRRAFALDLDRDVRSRDNSELLELESALAESEDEVERLLINSPLDLHMQFIFDQATRSTTSPVNSWDLAAAGSCGAGSGVPPAHVQASAAAGAAAGVDSARWQAAEPTEPPVRVAWQPRSALARLRSRAQRLVEQAERFAERLNVQLVALRRARDYAGVHNGDRRTPERRIAVSEAALDRHTHMLQTMRSFAAEVAQAEAQQNRAGVNANDDVVLGLERQAVRLVFDFGQYLLDSPMEANANYIFTAAMASGAGDTSPDAGGAGCGLPGASASAAQGGQADAAASYVEGNPDPHAMAQDFRRAGPVGGNPHIRRLGAGDGPRVEIEALMPRLTTSDASNFMVASTFFAGLFAGLGVGGPVGAMLADNLRPCDVIEQGYSVKTYQNSAATAPVKVRYFYGWLQSPSALTAATVGGSADVQRMPNLADRPEGVSWHTWYVGGSTEPRRWGWPEAYVQSLLPGHPSLQGMCQTLNLLVQRAQELKLPGLAQGSGAAAGQGAGNYLARPDGRGLGLT